MISHGNEGLVVHGENPDAVVEAAYRVLANRSSTEAQLVKAIMAIRAAGGDPLLYV